MSRWPGNLDMFERAALPLPGTGDRPLDFRYYATDDWGGTEYLNTTSGWVRLRSRNVKTSGELVTQASYTFSSLDGDTDKFWELEFNGQLSDGNAYLYVRPNNDSGTNYVMAIDGSDLSGGAVDDVSTGQSNGLFLARMEAAANSLGYAVMRINAKSGLRRVARVQISEPHPGSNAMRQQHGATVWRNSADNIMSLVVRTTAGTFSGEVVLRRLAVPA